MISRRLHQDVLGVTGAQTVIGSGVVIQGTLESESDITIDGSLNGDIKTIGNVSLGVNAIIKANIEASNVTVAGQLTGDANASGEVTITETGHVKGNIRSAGLAIAPGGIFIGRSAIVSPARLSPEDNADEQVNDS